MKIKKLRCTIHSPNPQTQTLIHDLHHIAASTRSHVVIIKSPRRPRRPPQRRRPVPLLHRRPLPLPLPRLPELPLPAQLLEARPPHPGLLPVDPVGPPPVHLVAGAAGAEPELVQAAADEDVRERDPVGVPDGGADPRGEGEEEADEDDAGRDGDCRVEGVRLLPRPLGER